MASPGGKNCYCCDAELAANNVAWDFDEPDDFARMSAEERAELITVQNRWVAEAKGYGTALRVILPVSLDTGQTATLGVWMAIADDDMSRVLHALEAQGDAWAGCTFRGRLLNAVRPWPDTYLAKMTAAAHADRKLAYVVDTEDELLKRVLTQTWPYDLVVDR